MKICDIAKIINNKIEGTILNNSHYISTENMIGNCGGVVDSSSVPTTKVTQFTQGDILLSNIRPYFKKVWFSVFDGGCSNDVICIRTTSDSCLAKYLYYALCTDKFIDTFSASSKGTKMPRGDKNALLSYEIPDRNIAEQQHIVDILGSIDDKIENNGKIIENLEQFAIAEYQKITKEADSFICLGDVIDIFDSKRKPLSSREREAKKGSYRYFGATGVLDYVNNYLFDGEYVLLAEDGTVIDAEGFPIVQLVTGQFWINNHAHIMQAKSNYTNYSLYVALKRLQVKEAVTGAVQLKINQANLCALELPYITPDVLLGYNNMIEPMFKKIIHIRNENEVLNKLKQLYLQKFFG